jgi:hypothetical protein
MNRCVIGDCRESMQVQDLAYCAGVIDSDGTIGVKRSTYAMRHGNGGQATFSERVCVRQVEPQAVTLLHILFGGTLGVRGASAKKGKPLTEWCVTDQKAARCLVALLPYLRIKRQQAENCLALREVKEESKRQRVAFGRGHAGAAVRPAHLSVSMESHYLRAKELNRVGVV